MGRNVGNGLRQKTARKNLMAIETCVMEGFVRNLEIEYSCRSGKNTPVEINANVIGSGGSRRIIALCRDIFRSQARRERIAGNDEQSAAQEEELRIQLEELIRTNGD